MLKSKIHRATVTEANVNYVGSITIDETLMNAANLIENEQVDVYDITNGERLTTYVIKGKKNSGEICMNGAAAKIIKVGDKIIIASYAMFNQTESKTHQPQIIGVNDKNIPIPINGRDAIHRGQHK